MVNLFLTEFSAEMAPGFQDSSHCMSMHGCNVHSRYVRAECQVKYVHGCSTAPLQVHQDVSLSEMQQFFTPFEHHISSQSSKMNQDESG